MFLNPKCLTDSEFKEDEDNCTKNPKDCNDGMSASLFYKLEFDVDPDDLESNSTKNFTREYILSTGKWC